MQKIFQNAHYQLFSTGSLPERLIKALAVSPCFWIPALPLLAAVWLGHWIVQARRRSAPDGKSAYYIIVTAAYLGLVLSVVVTRADIIHFMYLQPLNCLMLAWLLDGCDLPPRLLRAARPFLVAYVPVALLAFGLALLAATASAGERLTTRRGVVTTRAKDSVVEYFQARVPEGKTILVYPYLPLYYYLTGTFSPGQRSLRAP